MAKSFYMDNWTIKNIPNREFMVELGKDVLKSTIIIPAYMLQVVCLWPVPKNFWQKLFVTVFLFNEWIMYILNGLYFVAHISDLEIMAIVGPAFCSYTQVVAKGLGFFMYPTLLNKAIYVLWKDFWPANLLGEDDYHDISFIAKIITLFQKSFPILSLSVTFLMVVPSLIFYNNRLLGIELFLPEFKYITPYYEYLVIWEIVLFPHGIWIVLCYDLIFIALLNNIATQFRILSAVIEGIGSYDSERTFANRKHMDMDADSTDDALLKKCIKQHYMLLQYCKDLDAACTYVVFCQFFSSVMGICISSVLFSIYPEKRVIMMAYCLIYLLQIFIYCHPGNELKYYSTKVVEGITKCNWYRCNNKLQKSLVPVMVRSGKECILSVGHFFELDLKNLVNILKMSFSFFTLLGKMLEKQQPQTKHDN